MKCIVGVRMVWGMRLGVFKDRPAFEASRDRLDFVAIPAHIAALMPSAVSSFVSVSMAGLPFLIDPYTAAFALPWTSLLADRRAPSKGAKKSLSQLARSYGEPFSTCVDKKTPLRPDLIEKDAARIAKAVTEYQENSLVADLGEDADFFDVDTSQLVPSAIIPPYFSIRPEDPPGWLRANLTLLRETSALPLSRPMIPAVVLDSAVLESPTLVDLIVRSFSEHPSLVYAIWIDGLDEAACSLTSLTNLRTLISGLSAFGGRTIALHGGYFSALLNRWGLQGLCHGPGYGENKEVDPPAGGFPSARYYVPALHYREKSIEVLNFIQRRYGNDRGVLELCTCPTCQRAANEGFYSVYGETKEGKDGRGYPTADVLANCRDHFLFARQRELEYLETASWNETVAQLGKAIKEFPGALSQHLPRWLQALA